jgi:hypothetical protein
MPMTTAIGAGQRRIERHPEMKAAWGIPLGRESEAGGPSGAARRGAALGD